MGHDCNDVESLRAKLTQAMFRKAVFPAMDALVAFVPQGRETPREIKATVDDVGKGRWYVVPGGWRVKCPYVGQEFDEEVFTIEKGGWNHGHCDICSATIDAGDSCWVSDRPDRDVICDNCFITLRSGPDG